MGNQRGPQEGREETDQSDRGGFLPFRAENTRVEFGACQEREHDGAGAGQKSDPGSLGAQRLTADQRADRRVGPRCRRQSRRAP